MENIYLDAASTTKPFDSVVKVVNKVNESMWQNPSGLYKGGYDAKQAIETARKQVAKVISAPKEGIIFTSCGSESDNQTLIKVAEIKNDESNKNIIVTSAIEHHAILNTCKYLSRRGFETIILPVNKYGFVQLESLEDTIKKYKNKIALVSIMAANNEIGTIQDFSRFGQMCRLNGILFHTDAVQAYGHIPIDVRRDHIDLLSASAHKINSVLGAGLLYCDHKSVTIKPLINGGHQEFGLRAGTENTAAIVGFGEAAESHTGLKRLVSNCADSVLRDTFYKTLVNKIEDVELNGSISDRLPNNLNVRFKGVNSQQLQSLLAEKGIYCSIGSACNNGDSTPSHVLKAIGLSDEEVFESVRFTFDNYSVKSDELHRAISWIQHFVKELRG